MNGRIAKQLRALSGYGFKVGRERPGTQYREVKGTGRTKSLGPVASPATSVPYFYATATLELDPGHDNSRARRIYRRLKRDYNQLRQN